MISRLPMKRKLSARLNAFKHADWYGDEYEKGEYIKGLGNESQCGKDEAKFVSEDIKQSSRLKIWAKAAKNRSERIESRLSAGI